jgi:protein phosphatase
VLQSLFTDRYRRQDFPGMITIASDQAARVLLDWAICNGHEARLREGLDLMGTTLVVAWIEDHFLNLANIGDSRAYLIHGTTIEQLTIDGDLGSGLLAAGTPPEQVRDLGGLSKALRECVGGCHVASTGELEPLPDSYPTLSQCPLLPGDIVILCSDGLVEEGAFLDPKTVLDLVRPNRELPAQALATLLADSADALQRPPSLGEPEGFGDNISCVVVKVAAVQ